MSTYLLCICSYFVQTTSIILFDVKNVAFFWPRFEWNLIQSFHFSVLVINNQNFIAIAVNFAALWKSIKSILRCGSYEVKVWNVIFFFLQNDLTESKCSKIGKKLLNLWRRWKNLVKYRRNTNLISLIFKLDFKTSYSYYHNFSICRELCGLRTNFFEVPRVNFDIFTLIW